MNVIRKDATITNTDEEFPGSFEVVLSAPTKDRDGETLLPEEWKQPLPSHITFDVDHGMSVATTVGSGVPSINDAGELVVAGTYSSLPRAQEVRTLVNEGHIKTTSVAFMSEPSETKDGKKTTVRELLNGAFVAIPSNREALVLSSKGVKAGARNSAADASVIQSMHDAAVSLGADCSGAKSYMPAPTTLKAVAGSLEAVQERVQDALNDAYGTDSYVWLRATLSDSVIYELSPVDGGSDSETYQESYTDDGSVVTLAGDATAVDLAEVVKPDPDEDASAEPAASPATAPAKAAALAETKAADDDDLQTRVQALSLSVSTYTD
jgi:hypothetical protein